MTSEEFRHLLHSGHGRALVYLEENCYSGLEEIILEACLRNTRFDCDLEESRVPYFLKMISLLEKKAWPIEDLFAAMRNWQSDHWPHQNQQLELLAELVKLGRSDARQLLRMLFERNCEKGSSLGARQILKLDNAEGYAYILQKYGENLEVFLESRYSSRNDLDEGLLFDMAAQILTAPIAEEIFHAALAKYPDLTRDYLSTDHLFVPRIPIVRTPKPHLPYIEYRRRLLGSDAKDYRNRIRPEPRHWAQAATEDEIAQAAADFEIYKNSKSLPTYLSIFRTRDFPGDLYSLIPLLHHADRSVQYAAAFILARHKLPILRSTALTLLDDSDRRNFGLWLLRNNFEAGDEDRIENIVTIAIGEFKVNGYTSCALDIAEANPGNWNQVVLHSYESVTDSRVRYQAAQLLVSRSIATPTHLREFAYDAHSGIRVLAAGIMP